MCHVVDMAEAEVVDNPQASSAVKEFASIRKKDAEEKGHQVLQKWGLSLKIPIRKTDVGPNSWHKGFPYIKFSDWVEFLLQSGRLARLLCACDSIDSMRAKLRVFWDRYRGIHPDHLIFEMESKGLDLTLVVPVFTHSDEGRSLKHQPLFVLSTHGALGRGTQKWLDAGKDKIPLEQNSMGLPFVGPTWTTQFIFTCMLRKIYKRSPATLDAMVALHAEDLKDLLLRGVTCRDSGLVIRCCHLGTKGDLPALATLGRMLHNFRHCPKAASSRKPAEGICWMCCAGRENGAPGGGAVPYEDMSGKPAWEGTLGQQQIWEGHVQPEILSGIPLAPAKYWTFFKTDVWHNFHLGVGKHWAAGGLVVLMERLPDWADKTMDEKVATLAAEYQSFCAARKMTPYVEELCKDTLG